MCDVGAVEVVPPDFTLTVATDGSGSVTSTPAGIDCGSTCMADFPGGTTVELDAEADLGHVFDGWTGSCTGTVDPCMLPLLDDESVTAHFAVGRDLSVTVDGTGSGSVTGPGIACPDDCGETYADETMVTLTAAEDAGSAFTGWSDDCSGTGDCALTMTAAKSVTATFTDLVLVTVTVDGSGSGTVTSGDGLIDCGLDCQEEYLPSTSVQLEASPAPGSMFSGWSDDCSGKGFCDLTPTTDASVMATFLPIVIFADGFESGSFSAWDGHTPP